MSDPTVLGYWFRYNPSRKALHVARWTRTETGSLVVEAACRGQVVEPRAPEVPAALLLQPTPVDALRIADNAQRRALCTRCAARYHR